MCDQVKNSVQLHTGNTKENNGEISFNDSLWTALKNPKAARAVFKRRLEENQRPMQLGVKLAAPRAAPSKRSLGLVCKPITKQKNVSKKLQANNSEELQLSPNLIDINKTIQLNEFNPPLASTPGPAIVMSKEQNNNKRSSQNSSLDMIQEEENLKSPEKLMVHISTKNSSCKTPTKRLSINPTALRAILQNAEQYSPKKPLTPQKRPSDVDSQALKRTPPKSREESDERLEAFNNNLSKGRSNRDDAGSAEQLPTEKSSRDVTSISVIEILDSTIESQKSLEIKKVSAINEEQSPDKDAPTLPVENPISQDVIVPETPYPVPVLEITIPEEDITIPETQDLNAPSRIALDLRLRRSQSLPQAIDLRIIKRRTRRLSESSVYESTKSLRKTSQRFLSQSLKVASSSKNPQCEQRHAIEELNLLQKSVSKEYQRQPCESEVPAVQFGISGTNTDAEQLVENNVSKGLSPLINRPSSKFSTPEIMEKIDEDIRKLLAIESQAIIKPPQGFSDSAQTEELAILTENLIGNDENGQFEKVSFS